jgi:subtilisin family serine protease
VSIYVVDGIFDKEHDEFRNLFDGTSRVHEDSFASDTAAKKYETYPKCASDHATNVASLAAGYGYGVAKNSTLISVGVQPGCEDSGYASDLLEGMSWIHEHYLNQPEPRAPAVATMSPRVPNSDAGTEVERAIKDLIASGVIVVAAAGNYAEDACESVPARIPEVVTVAAADESLSAPWSWSNTGACVDIWSPGENILGASPDCATCTFVFSGTSQATPIVAGLVAHFLETSPTASPEDVQKVLTSTASQFDAATSGTISLLARFLDE